MPDSLSAIDANLGTITAGSIVRMQDRRKKGGNTLALLLFDIGLGSIIRLGEKAAAVKAENNRFPKY